MVLSRVATHQTLKNKKKKRYRVYAGTVLLAAMIPYMSVPTYALLTDQVQETGQGVQAAFVFPETIKELAEKAAELKAKMDTYAAEAESTAGKISSSETAAGANSLVDSVAAKNSAAEAAKIELEKVVKQLQEYFDRAQKEKDESKAILEQTKSSDRLTGDNLKQVQSLLGDGTSQKNSGDEDVAVAVDSDLLEKIQNKVKFYDRVYSYVESGFKKADKENTDADETLARMDSILSGAQAAAAGVEERIKEEERKKKEEEAKKQAEEAKKQEEAKQKEEIPPKGEKSVKPESGGNGQEPKQGNDNGGPDASKGPAGSSDTSKGNPDPGKEDDSAKGTSETSPAQTGNDDSAAGTDKSAP